MGTNYYLYRNVCEHCGRSDDRVHIGKSSAGWCFALCVYPNDRIYDLPDWEFELQNGVIKDEYGELVSFEELISIITKRSGKAWDDREYGQNKYQYSSEALLHDRNESERGPNNLLRSRIGRYCVGHGSGTWDLFDGDFS